MGMAPHHPVRMGNFIVDIDTISFQSPNRWRIGSREDDVLTFPIRIDAKLMSKIKHMSFLDPFLTSISHCKNCNCLST